MVLIAITVIVFACNQNENKDESSNVLSIEEFIDNAGEYVDQPVKIAGTVNHVCKHGGKKMFIMDETGDKTVKITTGNGVSNFDLSLEGSEVIVEGVVKEMRIDETYLKEWEDKLKTQKPDTASEDCAADQKAEKIQTKDSTHAHDVGKDSHHQAFEEIAAYRKKIAESEKGYLSFYSVECTNFETKE